MNEWEKQRKKLITKMMLEFEEKGLTYKEIGKRFGILEVSAYKKFKHHVGRKKLPQR